MSDWLTDSVSDKNIITKEEHISLLRECDLCGWLPGGFFIFTADTSSLLMNKAEAFALGTADRKNSPPFLHKFVRTLPPWKIHNSISSSVDPSSPSLGSRTIEPNPSRLWAIWLNRQRWIYPITGQVEWVKSRVRRVKVFDFGTGRVGYLQKSSGTGTGRDR